MSAVLKPGTDEVRRMLEADLRQVLQIERRAYPFPWTYGVFRDCVRVGYGCWVRELKGRPAGYLILSAAAGEAHVLNVCVDPSLHGQGIGRELMEHGLYTASRLGAETVFLEVRPSNAAALRLYERLEFTEVGIRPGYYPLPGGRREDAMILARILTTPAS